jgi:hypothetical protein
VPYKAGLTVFKYHLGQLEPMEHQVILNHHCSPIIITANVKINKGLIN